MLDWVQASQKQCFQSMKLEMLKIFMNSSALQSTNNFVP